MLGLPGVKISYIKDVYSHGQALSQCSKFIKSHKMIEHVRADTAGSAEMVSISKDKSKAAIASSLSAKTYNLEVIKKNIENEKGNLTRFLVMGKNILQPNYENKKYITSSIQIKVNQRLFINHLVDLQSGVNLTKLQSYLRNTFDSFFFM